MSEPIRVQTALLLSLIIFSVSAQELDEEFLESLPDDIKEDLKEKKKNLMFILSIAMNL